MGGLVSIGASYGFLEELRPILNTLSFWNRKGRQQSEDQEMKPSPPESYSQTSHGPAGQQGAKLDESIKLDEIKKGRRATQAYT